MCLVVFRLAEASLHSLCLFFTFQTFSWGDIIIHHQQSDAVTVVWNTTELFQVFYLQFMEDPSPKMLVVLDEWHGIYAVDKNLHHFILQ